MRTRITRHTLLLSLASLAALACSSSSSDGASSADGGGDTSGRVPKQHRPAAAACAPSKGSGTPCGGGGTGECGTDADCKSGTNGHCAQSGGGAIICRCFYDTCVNDSDCSGANGVCACQGTPYQGITNSCASDGNCKLDADCGAGGYCSPSESTGCGGGLAGYFCHVAGDECLDDDECTVDASAGSQVCAYDFATKHWKCAGRLLCP